MRSKTLPELESSERSAELLQEIVKNRKAASIIRLGDGEGVAVHPRSFDDPLLRDYLVSHFGPHITCKDTSYLARRLRESVARASIIGLRQDMLSGTFEPSWYSLQAEEFLQKFKQTFTLRQSEIGSIDYGGAYRLALLNSGLQEQGFLNANAHFVSAWCHFDWLISGQLARLVRNEKRVGVISSHPTLATVIKKHGIKVDYYQVPSRYRRKTDHWRPHFPDRYLQLLKKLKIRFEGQVFLVGAGICGKIYCDDIFLKGGIGIDIGSVCDCWLGLATRPLVLLSKLGLDYVPEELTLDHQLAHMDQG